MPKGYKDNISSYVQQKPNRKLFGFWRFYLQLYNLPNPDKLVEKKKKQVERRKVNYNKYLDRKEAKQKKWDAQGKKDRYGEPKKVKIREFKDRLTFGEWLQSIGEAPAILDTGLVDASVEQLRLYANNKGFFQAEVRDSIVYKKKKASVYYIINRGPAYYIDSIEVVSQDSGKLFNAALKSSIVKNKAFRKGKIDQRKLTSNTTLLYPGMQYDIDVLKAERLRIEKRLKNLGYYLFAKENIVFKADSTIGTQRLKLWMEVKKPSLTFKQGDTTIIYDRHKQFKLDSIFVDTDYRYENRTIPFAAQYDKVFEGYLFRYRAQANYKPKNIAKRIRMEPGIVYRPLWDSLTQVSLSDLRNFRLINIVYEPYFIDNDSSALLKAYVNLTPSPYQSFSVDAQGTNTDGNLGISGSFSYRNNNIFKGAEILEFKVTAGAEIQVIQGDTADLNNNSRLPFNTLEVGAQISLRVPKLLFPFVSRFLKKNMRPFSRIELSYNYQNRPDYERSVGRFAFGYEFQQSRFKRHLLNVLELSLVDITKSDAFQAYLEQTNDLFVINTFAPSFIDNLSYTYIYNNIRSDALKNFIYFEANAQLGGNLMWLVSLTGGLPKNANNQYTVFSDIPYAQYARVQADLRYYINFNRYNSLVIRGFAGIGVPFGNSFVLPFVKSFFAGGANDMRAWRPRDLGPGSYEKPEEGRVDQVGDIKFVGNIEYRGKIYRFLEGALFADFGNVWLLRADTNRIDGEFRFDRFFNEIAIGVGAGIRLNFNFFVFRLDMGIPVYDPSFRKTNPWVVSYLKGENLRFNIAIGYPF